MKKINFIAILTLLLVTYNTSAQSAKHFLDQVSAKIKSYNNISIKFENTLDNTEANIHQSVSGTAVLQGDLYQFEFLGAKQFFDGKKVYLILEEDEEVIIKQPNSEEKGTVTPSEMLTFYEDGYTYEMDITQNIDGKEIQFVKLIPIDSNSEYSSILLGVEKSTKHIYKVIQSGKDGTVTSFTIKSFLTNQTIDPKLFVFNRSEYESKDFDITEPK